jgi:hypothetical protein
MGHRWASVALDARADEQPHGAGDEAPVATFTDACGETTRIALPGEAPYKAGTLLVDLADPSQPAIVDFSPQPLLGPHSVFATKVEDTYHVLSSPTNLAHPATYFSFHEIRTTPAGPQLVDTGRYASQTPPSEHESDEPPTDRLRVAWTPTVMEVQALESGELVVYDGTGGIYTVDHDASDPLPAPDPWTKDAWIGAS